MWVFEMGSHESKRTEGGRQREALGKDGRGIKGTRFKRAPKSWLLSPRH